MLSMHPPMMRRLHLLSQLGLLSIGLGFAAGIVLVNVLPIAYRPLSLLTATVCMIGGLTAIAYSSRQARQACRSIMRKRFRICGVCGHDLNALSDAGKCPECGQPFMIDQLKRFWVRYIRSRNINQRKQRARRAPRWFRRQQSKAALTAAIP